jgi:hypothetical protein
MSARQDGCVAVGGDGFDPAAFQARHGGQVTTPRRGGPCWQSENIPVDGELGEMVEALLAVIRHRRPVLISVKDLPGVTVRLQAVRYSEQCCGFNVPAELIQTAAELGASIDFDQHRHPAEAVAPPDGEHSHGR